MNLSRKMRQILEKRKRQFGENDDPTLKMLCINTIAHYSDFFLQIYDNTGLNPFNELPNTLKTDLLLDYPDYSEARKTWGKWEQLLVNKSLSRLKIKIDPDEDSNTFLNFCSTLATEQFKMNTFGWSTVYEYRSQKKERSAFTPLTIIISSPRFTDLQSLDLSDFTCKDQHLQMIASHLEKLRVLDLCLDIVTSKGVSALSTLQQLQKFIFYSKTARNDGNILYNLCLQLLPKLDEIGYNDVDLATYNHNINYQYIIGNGEYTVNFKSLPTPTELGVRQLFLHNYVGVIPQGVTMPNLTTLYLSRPLIDFPLDTCFSNVTDLGLLDLGMDKYLRILNFMGHQLLRLLIQEQEQDLQLDLILRLCPNLEELYIPLSPRHLNFTSPVNPDSDLQNLKVLEIELHNYVSDGDPEFSPGALVQLLSAPNLRQLKLSLVDITKEDAAAIVHGVQQGQMLQKLEKFNLENHRILDCESWDEIFNPELRDLYDCVIHNMVRHCPCLYHVDEGVF